MAKSKSGSNKSQRGQRSQRSQKGGEVVGQGTYGCVVQPAFKCKNKVIPLDINKVGKIGLKEETENEIMISKKLRQYKGWENYFILADLESCEPEKTINRKEDWAQCEITAKYPSEALDQITSDFGGEVFSNLQLIDLRPSRFDFFKFFTHLLEAGAILCLNGISHYDIHRSNVLVNSKGIAYFIDFGQSFLGNTITDKILDTKWKVYDPSFDSESPEITTMTGVRNKMDLNIVIKDVINKKPVLKLTELILQIPRGDSEAQLNAFFKKSRAAATGNWVSVWQSHWPEFDSFTLAALLLSILKLELGIPEFISLPAWKEKGEQMKSVLKKMLNCDPFQRLDCVESLAAWDPSNDVLKSGTKWLEKRKKQRALTDVLPPPS